VKLAIALLIVAAFVGGQGGQKFTGTITDDMCPAGNHSRMRMGATDGECAIACISSHGALYMLFDGKTGYVLSDQKTPQKFAGRKVIITGRLDAKKMVIEVSSITASN